MIEFVTIEVNKVIMGLILTMVIRHIDSSFFFLERQIGKINELTKLEIGNMEEIYQEKEIISSF